MVVQPTCNMSISKELLIQVCKIVLRTSYGMTNACLSECFYSTLNFNGYEELECSKKMLVCRQENETLWRLSESHKWDYDRICKVFVLAVIWKWWISYVE